jgi:predicted transcriptional regulator
MRYRDRTELFASILEATNDVITNRTQLMYRTFLSYEQLKQYLSILTENHLIEFRATEQCYKATEKGQQFLDLYRKMGKLVDNIPHS